MTTGPLGNSHKNVLFKKEEKGGKSSSPVSCTTPRTGVESGRSTGGQRCFLNGQVGLSRTRCSAAAEALTQQTRGLYTVSVCLCWIKKALNVCVLETETTCRLSFRSARTGCRDRGP